METKGLWHGRPLEEFTKDELIEIIMQLARMQQQERKQTIEERERLFGLFAK